MCVSQFQSTLPIREETQVFSHCCSVRLFQSTLPIREETLSASLTATPSRFQSTLPIREETRGAGMGQQHNGISIHSSHTGRDGKCRGQTRCSHYFNPLFPYGKRPALRRRLLGDGLISIHSSHTGRDRISACFGTCPNSISIHSSHTGRDYATV